MNEPNTSKYYSIELLRFFAAFSIVIFHTIHLDFLRIGVDIFFVISGLVIMISTEKNSKNFFTKRLIRILPTYYFFTFLIFFICLIRPELLINTTANMMHLIKSLLFITFDKNGSGPYPLLYLGWSLNYEMYFYAIFAFSLVFSKKYRSCVCAIFILLIYIYFRNTSTIHFMMYGDMMVFEFVLGMIIFEAYIKKNLFSSLFLLFTIIIGVILSADNPMFMISESNIFDNRLVKFGSISAIFVVMVIFVLKNIKLPDFIILLGGSSYALYLTHPYILRSIQQLRNLISGGVIVQNIIVIILSILFAIIVFKYLEFPISKFLRNKFLRN